MKTPTNPLAGELASDRRGHRRLVPSELAAPTTIRIPDLHLPPVSLVDLSSGGVLIELPFQLRPESRMTLEVSTSGQQLFVPMQLLRCYVADLKDGTRYRAAGIFERALTWPALGRGGRVLETADDLIVILKRLRGTISTAEPGSRGASFDELVDSAVTALRRGEPASMVSTVTKALLSRMVPSLVIHSGPSSMPQDTPASARFFGLEFRAATVFTAADRRFLRACAQMISLIDRRSERCAAENAGIDAPGSFVVRTVGEWQALTRANQTGPVSMLREPFLVG